MVPPKADPLRVSQTVKRMMDADSDYQKGKQAGKKDDVELLSKDQELIFTQE
jgi:serine/threonine-protein kinase ULK4